MLRKKIEKMNLIEILGLESLSAEMQVEVVNSAVNVIEMRCLNEVLEALDVRGRKRFVKLMDAGEAEEVSNFLEKKSVHMMDILENEVVRLKKETAHSFSGQHSTVSKQ